VRQVVFSAVEADTDVRGLCRRVGEALAREASNNVAVVGADLPALLNPDRVVDSVIPSGLRPLQRIATRLDDNLWLVPRAGKGSIASLHSYLGEVRREFEYSIVEGPSAAESDEAAAMAQFADGIVLVLSAHRTRRVTARKVKEALETAQARILGTVLSDRMFPMPEGIYRRL
jgi:Mrp family chromosome partitioning ATPase